MEKKPFFFNLKLYLLFGFLFTAAMIFILFNQHNQPLDINSSAPKSIPKNTNNLNETLLTFTKEVTNIKQSISSLGKDIESQQTETSEKILALEQAIEHLAQNQLNNNGSDQEVEDTYTLSDEEKIRQQRELAIQKTMEFDQALAFEDRDNEWASVMEESINIASQKTLYAGSTFNDPVCKSTFCRIEAYHQNLDSQDNFELIKRELPNSFYIQHLGNAEDGSLRSVIYFVRKGEESNNIIFKSLSDNG